MTDQRPQPERPTYTIRLEPDPHCSNRARALAGVDA
jgi:hypothetical protein